MINPRTQPVRKEDTLRTISILYPIAFAMAAATNSRTGVALRCVETPALPPAYYAVKRISIPLQPGYTL